MKSFLFLILLFFGIKAYTGIVTDVVAVPAGPRMTEVTITLDNGENKVIIIVENKKLNSPDTFDKIKNAINDLQSSPK